MADWLKKAVYLGTDDLETIHYNNDTNIENLDDVETVNYKNDTNQSDLDNTNLKKTSGAKIPAKKIIKKYKNLARKKPYQRPSVIVNDDFDDLEKVDYNNHTNIIDLNNLKRTKNAQVAARKILQKYKKMSKTKSFQKISKKPDNDVVFLKKISLHPRDRLARKTKDDIKFVKKVLLHPHERPKIKIKLEKYSHLNKRSKDDNVPF